MEWGALRRHWPLVPVLLLAALLRFQGPVGGAHFGDAAEYALVARSLADDPLALAYPDVEAFGPQPFVSQPPLGLYLFAAATAATDLETGPLLVNGLLGTATVALLYALADRLGGRWTATAAAGFLAVLPFHVRASREGLLDAPLAFFVVGAVLALALYEARPGRLRALLLGAAAAGAAFTKLSGVLAFAILLAPALWVWVQGRGRPRSLARDAVAFLAPAAVLLALYTALLWHLQATTDLLAKLGWQAGRVAGADTVRRPWHWYFTDAEVGFPMQLGLLLGVLALAGLGLFVRDLLRGEVLPTRGARIAVLAWVVVLLAFLLGSQRKEWFYALPLLPAVALLAAWPVGHAMRWANRAAARPAQPKGPPAFRPAQAPAAADARAPAPTASAAPTAQPMPPAQPMRPPPAASAWAQGKAAAVALVLVSLAAWTPVSLTAAGPGIYGAGVREAAEWIHERDPDAAQVGTTLGRYTLHLYNGQPTYHYYLNHTFVDDAVRSGDVRYLVWDHYLREPGEQAWIAGLVERHQGVQAAQFHGAEGVPVTVWRLGT